MLSPKTIVRAFYEAGYNTIYHDGIEHAGYLAFLNLLGLFPFLVFIVALAGFLGEGAVGSHFIQLVAAQLPPHMMQSITPRVTEITSGPPQGLLTVAILGAIWTSSSAVEGYRTVLNRAYHVATPPAYVWRRLLSIAQVLILSFVIVIAMIIQVMLHISLDTANAIFDNSGVPLTGGQIAHTSLALILVVISLAYYFLPNLKQKIHSVLPGAALVTLLWVEAAHLLSIYISQFNQVNLIYGSLAGVIATLLFFYVSNIIFIYGAELNYLLKRALGEKIEQKRPAQKNVNDF
jgi:membrane protein